MKELAIFIDTKNKVPVYEQIYVFIKNAIIKGEIQTGEALPSSRMLAEYLQCSRSTVLMAYDQLSAEGYICSIPQKGCFVMELEEQFDKNLEVATVLKDEDKKEYDIDFSPVGIDTASFPFAEWRKNSKQIFEEENRDLFNSGDARGDYELRHNISEYLRKSRGVKADPERIIIGAGYESLLMILDYVLDKQIEFGMENPVYPKAYKIIKALGRNVVPIELDQYGISVEKLEKSAVKVAYVTPSHQYPTGIVMSAKRRQDLIKWSMEESDRYIIEDDYDSEFRYKGRPIPSLQGMDVSDRVIYIGTFSKSISPAIRMSYMVLPVGLYDKYRKNMKFVSNTVSRVDQKLVSMFMQSGGFERHLNRMRTTYKAKHEAMLSSLKGLENITIMGENAGAHMLVEIDNGMSESQLVKKAEENGIKVYSLQDCYIAKMDTKKTVIMLGFARLEAEKIREGIMKLKTLWGLT